MPMEEFDLQNNWLRVDVWKTSLGGIADDSYHDNRIASASLESQQTVLVNSKQGKKEDLAVDNWWST